MSVDLLDSMLDLMRRLPPTSIEENVSALVQICPDYADDLLGSVDQPLKLMTDGGTGREYLACDYNRDGESYRSPWSNEYDPPLDDGTKPSPRLRKLETAANDAFDTYREMYFEGGVSSVYLWDLEHDGGFAGVVLLKKTLPGDDGKAGGMWDSIHVFETSERGRNAHYKLTSTIMLHLTSASAASGEVNLSGSMTRQTEQDAPLADPLAHVANVGRLVEDMEIKMRNLLQEVYFGKTKDVVFDLRTIDSLAAAKQRAQLQRELVGMMKKPST
ncbi:F-actin capping protein beta subunit [Auriculariales sp. MPI-PUGE-AT-0066]|nr:F-actin capping protein beta subunit [Auriculariales sp. MPI-PUGE-AT-0066]